jgi:uncharacterized radical SAM superfamily Fe-S cluster-containing enzyme
MNLATLEQSFTYTPDAAAREVFHSFSKSMCPRCRELVDAARIIRAGKVYLRKQCPRDGGSEALISGDAEWFLKSMSYVKKSSVPLKFSTKVDDGCPKDCGLCPDHEQHSCLPIIEITNYCNLECPICIVQNKHNYHMSREEFVATVDGLVEKEGFLDTINLSGGEPTMHPEFLDFLDIARARLEISRVSISTNGLKIATDFAFCEELAKRKVYVNLQLDAMSNPSLRVLRGNGDHHGVKERALANMGKAGIRGTIVATVAKGINDHAIGDAVRLLYEHDFILSLMFQPAAYTGYGGAHFAPHNPLDVITIPDVVRACEEQTGELRRSDFYPLPCSHPGCFALTYLLKTDAGFVPFPRFIELEQYLEAVSNRGTIRPDEQFESALHRAIHQLWSAAGNIPDSARILRTLKRALRLMYPEDRVLSLEQRLHLGEGLVKTIFIHAFMDEHTFEIDRIKKCCTHYALPDGRLMPGCAYNMFYRNKDARFQGDAGSSEIWSEGTLSLPIVQS